MEERVKPSIEAQFATFTEFAADFFPNDEKALRIVSCKGNEDIWGFNHIDILGALAGYANADPILDTLRIPYVVFSAHYFVLDDVIDENSSLEGDVLYITHLLFLTYARLLPLIAEKVPAAYQKQTLSNMSLRISQNADAIRNEVKRRSTYYEPGEIDYQIIVGRSNSTLQFYEILCWLKGNPPDQKIIQLLSDLVYYLQFGDDLGDWRKDFERKNYTVLLQECFRFLTADQRNNINAVEETLYTQGVYESYVARIVNNLDRIESEFQGFDQINVIPICDWIKGARAKAVYLLTNMVSKKMEYLAGGT
jgi:hypothetical protein